MKLEISAETADLMVVDILRDTYSGIVDAIKELKAKDILEHYEEEDLQYNTMMEYHLEKVLRHFSVQSEHEKFLEGINDKVEK